MPKAPNVSVSERKLWLEKWENGDRVDEIAKKAGRSEEHTSTAPHYSPGQSGPNCAPEPL